MVALLAALKPMKLTLHAVALSLAASLSDIEEEEGREEGREAWRKIESKNRFPSCRQRFKK